MHNLSLLNEIKSYFNEKGSVNRLSNECSIYKTGSKSDIMSTILPKMVGKESIAAIMDAKVEELKLPLLKYNKIYYACKIFELSPVGAKLSKETMDKVIALSYYISRESDHSTQEQYVEKFSIGDPSRATEPSGRCGS